MTAPFERVLILGASGQLGRALVDVFADCRPAGLDRAQVDVEDAGAVAAAFARLRPTLVVNTTAYHQVEQCELHPDRAFAVNAVAVERLATLSALAGAVFAHVSTDYVFDGAKRAPYDESDEPRPLNAYGVSKLAGELLVRKRDAPHFIVRTSGLFGRLGRSNKGLAFIERILRQAEGGEPIRVVDDIAFAPSYAPHVAAAMRAMFATERYGIYHVTNAGGCTWHELAVEAVRAAGSDAAVAATSTDPASGFARRPAYSVLAPGALVRAGFATLPPWRDAVRAYVEDRRAGA